MISYILAGLLGTTIMILWGVYGDLLVEKFEVRKVIRSLLFGLFWSILVYTNDPLMPLFIVSLVVIGLERASTEIYKAFIRNEDQSKYAIPTNLNLNLNKFTGYFVGASLLLLHILLVAVIDLPQGINNLVTPFFVGLAIALGGMFKDAPYEGFDKVKFFRSPIVATIVGIAISVFYPVVPGKYFIFAIGGGERIISEFYKKIIKGRVPGKFKSKTFDQAWQGKRWKILIPYFVAIAGLILLCFIK